MTEPEPPRSLPRRGVLAVGAGVALLAVSGSSLLTGCRSTQAPSLPAPPPTPTPDEVLRRRAVARITAVRDAVARLGAPAGLAHLPADLSAACATQLTALGEAPATPSGTSTPGGPGSPTGSAGSATSTGAAPTPTASTGTASTGTVTPVPATPADIVAAQLAAASEALRDCTAAGAPGLAVLLARLAAGHAAGADLLSATAHLSAPGTVVPAPAITATSATTTSATTTSATTPASTSATTQAGASSPAPSLDTEQVGALTRLLQGEHAAVYAYGVVTAWVAPPLRDRAHLFWSDHLADRDTLEQLLIASGASAPAASAAYDLGAPPTGSPAAVALAANVEGRLAALAASAVGAGTQSRRLLAAELLISAARRQSAWTSAVSALPGG